MHPSWMAWLGESSDARPHQARKRRKRTRTKRKKFQSKTPSSTPSTSAAPVSEKIMPSPIISEAVKLSEPVREDQQRELFKWILEEKRKVKPKDSEERKRIDDEKAILKQFIRAKSIPGI
ncbi:WAS/WASL-INTERACTING FAMILY PROTEIN [Salix viminalis]|uniref:WAS/WASL-INTERACTING FAMILY PROTEIN n=1 Tax=Salix viminalis TaxID=40686 RepID=A0A9Q0TPI0_SALVM|nr:WAS/WASL-INTERACTING FAMILY PROTEIN [Salix viminalis]